MHHPLDTFHEEGMPPRGSLSKNEFETYVIHHGMQVRRAIDYIFSDRPTIARRYKGIRSTTGLLRPHVLEKWEEYARNHRELHYRWDALEQAKLTVGLTLLQEYLTGQPATGLDLFAVLEQSPKYLRTAEVKGPANKFWNSAVVASYNLKPLFLAPSLRIHSGTTNQRDFYRVLKAENGPEELRQYLNREAQITTRGDGIVDLKEYLQGDGILTEAYRFFKGSYPGSDAVKKLLHDHGASRIVTLTVRRTPIQSTYRLLLNALTLGKFEKEVKSKGYDKVFHLGLVALLADGTRVMIEKNQRVTITHNPPISPDSEDRPVALKGTTTIADIIERALGSVGEATFFTYEAGGDGTRNCQGFTLSLLRSSNLLTASLETFIKQDVGAAVKTLPSWHQAVLDMAAVAEF